ncbi:MAG: MarR family winged helix-turn-helix transcriptional regulator [Pigmentiphaga sp.]
MKKKNSQSRPFSDDYLPVLLALATHAIADEFHEVISQHGLSILEWRVLASLEHGKPVATSHLATITLTKQPTVTRLLDRLEAQGHIVRRPNLEDRRVTLVQATAQGVKAIMNLVALAREHERHAISTLTFDVEGLKEQLREIIQTRNSRSAESLSRDIVPVKMARRLRTSSGA